MSCVRLRRFCLGFDVSLLQALQELSLATGPVVADCELKLTINGYLIGIQSMRDWQIT